MTTLSSPILTLSIGLSSQHHARQFKRKNSLNMHVTFNSGYRLLGKFQKAAGFPRNAWNEHAVKDSNYYR